MIPFIVLGIIGALLGFLLVFASIKLHVEEDTRVVEVNKMLPGYNCGACGYPGCPGFAEAIVEGEVKALSLCKPGKDEHYNKIKEFLQKDGKFKDLK